MIDSRESYANWKAYARACTNAQLQEVLRRESARADSSDINDIIEDSMLACAAVRYIAESRGVSLD